ncbi:MAG: TlpA family protein disulfide reductase [Gammaproteobacteria bacterium]|nr:TlpA family protein disulfide reductase [Gammaproteobacteria bacterium]
MIFPQRIISLPALQQQAPLRSLWFVLLLLVLSGCQPDSETADDAANQTNAAATETSAANIDYPQAPAFSLANSAGENIAFPRESGSTDIYFFWATWCPYCKQLMPHLQSIVDEYDGRVTVHAISIRENGEPAEYLDNHGYSFVLYPQGDEVATLYGVKGTPGLIVVDAAGRIRFDLASLLAPAGKALEDLKHGQRAQRIAPWWAAQLRQALDQILK